MVLVNVFYFLLTKVFVIVIENVTRSELLSRRRLRQFVAVRRHLGAMLNLMYMHVLLCGPVTTRQLYTLGLHIVRPSVRPVLSCHVPPYD